MYLANEVLEIELSFIVATCDEYNGRVESNHQQVGYVADKRMVGGDRY